MNNLFIEVGPKNPPKKEDKDEDNSIAARCKKKGYVLNIMSREVLNTGHRNEPDHTKRISSSRTVRFKNSRSSKVIYAGS